MRPLALLLPLALLALSPFAQGASDAPVVSFVRGEVTAKTAGGGWAPAAKGLALGGGDMVKTGAKAKAEISFPSGVMRLFENTLVVIPEVAVRGGRKDLPRVQQDGGSSVFRIDPSVGAGFSVKTRHVIAGVKGTSFGVTTSDQETRVVVYFGKVEVAPAGGGAATAVGTNQTVTATPAGVGSPVGGPTGDGFSGWSDTDEAQSADPAAASSGGDAGSGDGGNGGGPGGPGAAY